jgi:MoaD family protein
MSNLCKIYGLILPTWRIASGCTILSSHPAFSVVAAISPKPMRKTVLVIQLSRFVEAACGHKELSSARKVIHFKKYLYKRYQIKTVLYIRFYANMRTITGRAGLEVAHASAHTLNELLVMLTKRFPALQHNLLDERGDLYQDIPIFVNGRNPRLASTGIQMPLEPGDTITFFSPISSGRMNVEVMRTPAID